MTAKHHPASYKKSPKDTFGIDFILETDTRHALGCAFKGAAPLPFISCRRWQAI